MFVGIRAEGPRDFSPGRAGAADDALGQRRPKRPFRLMDEENVSVQRTLRPSGENAGGGRQNPGRRSLRDLALG